MPLRRSSTFLILAGLLSNPLWAAEAPLPPVSAAIPDSATEEKNFTVAPDAPIEVEPTPKPDVAGIGILNETEGLGRTLWNGIPSRRLQTLIDHIPDRIASPTLRRLLIRALSTQSDIADAKAGADLVAVRAQKLLMLGDASGARTLLGLVPAPMRSADMAVLGNQFLWLEGKRENACADIAAQSAGSDLAYWKQMRVVCQLLAGQSAEARLAQEVLREQNRLPAGFIKEVYARLEDPKAKINWPSSYTLSDAALLPLVGVPNSAMDIVIQALPTPLIRMLEGVGRFVLPTETALELKERAVAEGLIPVDALLGAYRATALPSKLSSEGASARAATLKAFDAATESSKKMDSLSKLIASFNTAESKPTGWRVAVALVTTNGSITPDPKTQPMIAASVFRGLLLEGKTTEAARWATTAEEKNLLAFAGGAALASSGQPKSKKCAMHLKQVASVFSKQPATDSFERTVVTLNLPSPHLWLQMYQAALDGRKGETLLLAAIALGDQSLAEISNPALVPVLASLHQAGFTQEARALAVESLLACE